MRSFGQFHPEFRHFGCSVQHDDLRRSACRGFYPQFPGIDRHKRFGLHPGDPEHLAVCRTKPADYVENRLHYSLCSLISQSYPSFSSRSASDLSPE